MTKKRCATDVAASERWSYVKPRVDSITMARAVRPFCGQLIARKYMPDIHLEHVSRLGMCCLCSSCGVGNIPPTSQGKRTCMYILILCGLENGHA